MWDSSRARFTCCAAPRSSPRSPRRSASRRWRSSSSARPRLRWPCRWCSCSRACARSASPIPGTNTAAVWPKPGSDRGPTHPEDLRDGNYSAGRRAASGKSRRSRQSQGRLRPQLPPSQGPRLSGDRRQQEEDRLRGRAVGEAAGRREDGRGDGSHEARRRPSHLRGESRGRREALRFRHRQRHPAQARGAEHQGRQAEDRPARADPRAGRVSGRDQDPSRGAARSPRHGREGITIVAIGYVDGPRFRRSLLAAADWVAAGRDELNRINVFPVPDGDTGTNMWLTLRAVATALRDLGGNHGDAALPLPYVAETMAQASVRGARGNSGMMLSQFLLGFREGIGQRLRVNARDLATAIGIGFERLRSSLDEPMEGTILTVAREAADEAGKAGGESDLRVFMGRIVQRAETALQKTPDLLAALKTAGVVDAGAKGFVRLLEGVKRLIEEGHVAQGAVDRLSAASSAAA